MSNNAIEPEGHVIHFDITPLSEQNSWSAWFEFEVWAPFCRYAKKQGIYVSTKADSEAGYEEELRVGASLGAQSLECILIKKDGKGVTFIYQELGGGVELVRIFRAYLEIRRREEDLVYRVRTEDN